MIRIKEVDLTDKVVLNRQMGAEELKNYLGGFGINLLLARDLIPPGVDPLSPENAVILGAGSLVGTSVPGANKLLVTTKYPMTGAIASGVAGMAFAGQMKWAGLDHLVVRGRAAWPVYIRIKDEDVEVCDASHLWGKDTTETTDLLRETYGEEASVLAIGGAGENRVPISLALVDKVSSIGKGGLGAVMGSKNLKALVALGTLGIKVARPDEYKSVLAPIMEAIRDFPPRLQWVEEGIMRKWEYRAAGFIYKNWTRLYPFELATKRFGPEVYRKKAKKGRVSCLSCPLAEKEILEAREGACAGLRAYAGNFPGRVSNWGIRCGAESCDEVIMCQDLANRSGICAHSASALIDFAMDLYERGILGPQDTGGLELRRDLPTTLSLLAMIRDRQGLGAVLGEGYRGMIDRFGRKVEDHAQHMKFMDFQKDARKTGLGPGEFAQVVNPRGGRHQPGGSFSAHHPGDDEMKRYALQIGVPESSLPRIFGNGGGFHVGRLTAHCESWYAVLNSLGICTESQLIRFYQLADCARLFSAVTGLEITPREMKDAGERIWSLLKLLNCREGFSRKDDRFPSRWLEPLETCEGVFVLADSLGTPLSAADLEALLDGYYQEHGWDVRTGTLPIF